MNIIRRYLTFLLISFAWPAASHATITPALEQRTANLLDNLITPNQKGIGDYVWSKIDGYDLTKKTRAACEGLAEDKGFRDFLEKKGADLDKADSQQTSSLIKEYMSSSTNFTPSMAAWFGLISDFRASWEDSFPLYRKVAAERPGDFLPKAVILVRPVASDAAADEWLQLLKEAYAAAALPKDRSFCLLLIPKHALLMAKIPNGEKQLIALDEWLVDLEKKETEDRLPVIKEMSSFRFWVAWARKDYVHAAELSRNSRFRSLRPMMLLLAEKFDEARAAIKELQGDKKLSRQERDGLDEIEKMLSDFENAKKKE